MHPRKQKLLHLGHRCASSVEHVGLFFSGLGLVAQWVQMLPLLLLMHSGSKQQRNSNGAPAMCYSSPYHGSRGSPRVKGYGT